MNRALDLLTYARRETRAQLRAHRLAAEGKGKEEMERLERELNMLDEPAWTPPTESEAVKQFNNLSRASEVFSIGQSTGGMDKSMRDDLKWAEEMVSKLRTGKA